MDYPIKTLAQLRPILQGFRKAAGLTQAAMASHLGVTQQTYAQLEANPAAVSVDRLFRVLRVLGVDLTLIPSAAGSAQSGAPEQDMPSPASAAQPARKASAPGSAKKASARKAQAPRNQQTSSATPARVSKTKAASRESRDNAAAKPSRGTPPSKSGTRKREDW